MARPRKQFGERDIEQLKILARCHCPDNEIAAFLQCSERTLRRRFGRILKEQRDVGRANLRALQYSLAMGNAEKRIPPNVTMAIWVGKQILGQRDRSDEKSVTINNNAALDARETRATLNTAVNELTRLFEAQLECSRQIPPLSLDPPPGLLSRS